MAAKDKSNKYLTNLKDGQSDKGINVNHKYAFTFITPNLGFHIFKEKKEIQWVKELNLPHPSQSSRSLNVPFYG